MKEIATKINHKYKKEIFKLPKYYTQLDDSVYGLGGAVFSSIVETVLPEIEQYYDFVIPMNVACGCWTVMDTVLTELESD